MIPGGLKPTQMKDNELSGNCKTWQNILSNKHVVLRGNPLGRRAECNDMKPNEAVCVWSGGCHPSKRQTTNIHCNYIILANRPKLPKTVATMFHQLRSSTIACCRPQTNLNQWWTYNTSSTAQGGGGSFKNKKPIGEVGCCESGMAERSHCWIERCLISLTLSLSFSDYLPTYLSIFYVSIYLSI